MFVSKFHLPCLRYESDQVKLVETTSLNQNPYKSPESGVSANEIATARRKKAKTKSRLLFFGSYILALLLLEHHFLLRIGPEKAEDSPSVFSSIIVLFLFWVLGRIVFGLFRR